MRKKLTPEGIDALPPATGKRYEARDDLVVGLVLRVSRTGGKAGYSTARVGCAVRRLKLGAYPILGLADAREKARSTQGEIQLGTFDAPKPVIVTLGEVIPQFTALYANPPYRAWRGTL